MKTSEGPTGFEELLGAWRKHVEAKRDPSQRDKPSGDEWGDWEEWFGVDSKTPKRVDEMEAQMQLMAKTINMLLDRVAVLEKLAVHDEKRLAEEIEKLRR